MEIPGVGKRRRNFHKITATTTTLTSLLLVLLLICLSGTADAQTSSEEKQCPYYWRKHNNRCFFMPSPAAQALETRREAIFACEAYGAQLVKILSAEENIFIRRILNSFEPTWVGGGGGKGDPEEFQEWIDGTPVNFTNFKDPDEPYDRRSEEREPEVKCTADCCGLTVDKNGDWRFKSCDTVLEYVCEIDLGRPLLKSVEDPGFIAPVRPPVVQEPVVPVDSEQSQSVEVNHPPHPHQHHHHVHVDNTPVEVTAPPPPPTPPPPPPPVRNVDTAVKGEQRESKQIDGSAAEQQNPDKPASPSETTSKPTKNSSGLSICTIGFHFHHILPLFIMLLVLKILE